MNVVFLRIAPVLSILSFVAGFVLYLIAASLYPGGGGQYHYLGSYWCELYNAHPGLLYAKASTLALVATLFFFWLAVPALFEKIGTLALFVRIAGGVSSIAASFIFTDLHDKLITLAVPPGLAAIGATCIGLANKRERLLVCLAIATVIAGSASYILWSLMLWKPGQPYVQKVAMILIFLWVNLGAAKVLFRTSAPALAAEGAKPE